MSTPEQIASYGQTLKELGPRQQEVLDSLTRAEPGGLSAWELSAQLGRLVHAVRPRVTELNGMGRIYRSGTRFCRETGRHEAVWRIVTKCGQMELL